MTRNLSYRYRVIRDNTRFYVERRVLRWFWYRGPLNVGYATRVEALRAVGMADNASEYEAYASWGGIAVKPKLPTLRELRMKIDNMIWIQEERDIAPRRVGIYQGCFEWCLRSLDDPRGGPIYGSELIPNRFGGYDSNAAARRLLSDARSARR